MLAPWVRGMCGVASRKNGTRPIRRRDVVGVGAEAEVAVAVRGRGGGDDERARACVRSRSSGTSEKLVGDQVDGAGPVRRPGDVRQEVRDVAQAVAVGAVEVGPVVQGVHLVDADVARGAVGAPASSASSTAVGSPLASGTMRSAPGSTWSSTASAVDAGLTETMAPTVPARWRARRSAGGGERLASLVAVEHADLDQLVDPRSSSAGAAPTPRRPARRVERRAREVAVLDQLQQHRGCPTGRWGWTRAWPNAEPIICCPACAGAPRRSPRPVRRDRPSSCPRACSASCSITSRRWR